MRLFAASLAFTTPAFSQQTPPAAQHKPAAQPQMEISDGQMKQFITLQKQVHDIQQNYTAKANQASDESTAAAMMQRAGQEMAQTIKESPFSIEQFNQIAALLRTDEKLQQQYRSALD